jgi:alpha-beta hydrolase superfamily lysophospholipase
LSIVRGYGPFRQLADAFARAGIATLRLDDRGYGSSGGDPAKATTADFASDARAALAWLHTRADVNGARLFVAGHSEGGMIAPMLAADDPALRGIVLMAGPAWTGRRVIEYQNRFAIAREASWPEARRDSVLRDAMTRVDSLGRETPWLGFFLGHDPLPVARRVHCPVLLVQGETDRQVDPAQARELAAAFREGGDKDVTVKSFAETNHLFLHDPSGDPAGYATLQETAIRPDILAAIVEWTRARSK